MEPTNHINKIPEQIRDEPLIRVSGVDDHIESGNAGSAPKLGEGASNGPFFTADDDEIVSWLDQKRDIDNKMIWLEVNIRKTKNHSENDEGGDSA